MSPVGQLSATFDASRACHHIILITDRVRLGHDAPSCTRKWRLRVFAGRTPNGTVRHIDRTFMCTQTAAASEGVGR